jgi:hypothetical protein
MPIKRIAFLSTDSDAMEMNAAVQLFFNISRAVTKEVVPQYISSLFSGIIPYDPPSILRAGASTFREFEEDRFLSLFWTLFGSWRNRIYL